MREPLCRSRRSGRERVCAPLTTAPALENVNSLLTLGKTDGYEMLVSRDHILRKLLTPEDGLVFLDNEKDFNEYEISSTLQQLEAHLDNRPDHQRPVLFYAQPMNIHVLGVNKLPQRTAGNWRHRPGFNDRVAFKLQQVDEFMGQFVAFLKARNLYEDSIIVMTADHGDAFPALPGLAWSVRDIRRFYFRRSCACP